VGFTTNFPVANAAGALAERIENNTLIFHLRPNQQFGAITYIDNAGDSNYHAFQFTLSAASIRVWGWHWHTRLPNRWITNQSIR
jgi:hypothetical protein